MNRVVYKAERMAGPHKGHIIVHNERVGSFAGIRRRTFIGRCYPCQAIAYLYQRVEQS